MTAAGRTVRLVNPNSNGDATARMVAAARAAAPDWMAVDGHTTSASPRLIVDDEGGSVAEVAVADEAARAAYDPGDGVIMSAYIDPGIDGVRRVLKVPVVGIGESSIRDAAWVGRFAVVMTTPGLIGCVRRYAGALGVGHLLVAVPSTEEDPGTLMADPERVLDELDKLIRRTVRDDGAEAVVVGGGPLADAARALARISPVPVIEPVPSAVRRMAAILSGEPAR